MQIINFPKHLNKHSSRRHPSSQTSYRNEGHIPETQKWQFKLQNMNTSADDRQLGKGANYHTDIVPNTRDDI